MSWYCRRPKPKNPPTAVPKLSSPLSEMYLKKMKDSGQSNPEPKKIK